jgi:aminoglycoside phosphotransferase family enzyme
MLGMDAVAVCQECAMVNATDGMSSPGSAERLDFLRSPAAHAQLGGTPAPVQTIETHMSWVFLVGEHVLKLKKPVKRPYLDFSTLRAREFNCREELRLNSRLAPGVYLGLVALHWNGRALSLIAESALPAGGRTLDWLVLMRRLPRERMLDTLIASRAVRQPDIDALGDVLVAFYRTLPRLALSGADYLARFEREQAANRDVLVQPPFDLQGAAQALDGVEHALQRDAALLRERAEHGHIVEGHGDLRPEHVCLLQPPLVIDTLEFNARLRQVDPFDEIAYLGLECDVAGADWIGAHLARRCVAALEPDLPLVLMPFYRAYRSLLRARLAAAHLLDPPVRDPHRWLPLAQRYVNSSLHALEILEQEYRLSAATTHGSP